jgi:hypothetical protein
VLDRQGKLVRAYPYPAKQLTTTKRLVDNPSEVVWDDPTRSSNVIGLAQLPGGDLIVVFHMRRAFPEGGGVARIGPAGIRWFRRDYTNHWPLVLPNGDILLAGTEVGRGNIRVPVADGYTHTLQCPHYTADVIRRLDPNGKEIETIKVFDALLKSPFRSSIATTFLPCDPLHMNFVVPLGAELSAKVPGTAPDDYLVSMRHISAFGIVSRRSRVFTHLYKGSFALQHAVQPLGGSKVIMIDNWGAGAGSPPSRVISYDLVTHEEESILKLEPSQSSYFTSGEGVISISPDRTRAIATFTVPGTAYEFRLSDGKAISLMRNLQDVSSMPSIVQQIGSHSAIFNAHGVYYSR